MTVGSVAEALRSQQLGPLGDGTKDEAMEFDQNRGPAPAPHTPTTTAVSMAAIDRALNELVSRMESEIAYRGVITAESARDLRSLRVGAEQLLTAQTDPALAF